MKSKTKKSPKSMWVPKFAKLGLVGAIATALNPASALEVTGSFSGFWDQPEQENHGMIISVSTLATGEKTGVAYWAFYDQLGNSRWLLAQGPIVGDTITAEVLAVEGVTFLQPDNPDNNPVSAVGTMQIQFDNCDQGNVIFNTPQVIVGTGGFRIQRITTQPGVNCSGGISDDIPPRSMPEQFDIDLISTGVYPDASGDVEYAQSPGTAELEIDVEGLPVGTYAVQVGGITRGLIEVRQDNSGDTEGELDFSSPLDDDDDLLLDFDPRGQVIDILEGDTVVLTTVAPEVGTTPGSDPGDPIAFGNDDIDIDLDNAGVYPDGEGDADLDVNNDGDRAEFEVEIKDIPVGSYVLRVGDIERGQIQVVNDDDDEPEGEIEFTYPASPGALLLDFDPRGELIEVLENGTLIFSGLFPLVDDDDDSGDDNGSDDGSPDSDISVEFNNTGIFPDGSADADYDLDSDSASFAVNVDDIPAGSYNLAVDGIVRGQIVVESDDDGSDVSFSNPLEDDDDLLLDFDPRGTQVEIFDGDTLLFFVDFPEE